MYSSERILLVKQLRSSGKSYDEILRVTGLKIPKSTLSYWCKNISLPKTYIAKLRVNNINHLKIIRKKANSVLREQQHAREINLQKNNIFLLKKINKESKKIMLCMLYLTEGAKYEKTRFLHFTSSNPLTIVFFLTLLKKCYKIKSDKFRVRIQCRFDQNKKDLVAFWSKKTSIPTGQFYPAYVDMRTKKSKTTKANYMGVCGIYYFDTQIQLELELLSRDIIKKIIGPMA